MGEFKDQLSKIKNAPGFIAALDQSGGKFDLNLHSYMYDDISSYFFVDGLGSHLGSTPKALRLYGITESSYKNNDEMFDLIHNMRTRIMSSSVFDGNRILGVILFENTMDREIEGSPTAEFLWKHKNIVPFLKVDKGLAEEMFGVQLMKPIPGLDDLLKRAKEKKVFGTKMRSFIKHANVEGIKAIVDQQFEIGKRIMHHGLVPILEPEIDIRSSEKVSYGFVMFFQLTVCINSFCYCYMMSRTWQKLCLKIIFAII